MWKNGEKPRFWSGEFEGQYGFRLRTRDHNWIVGQIYISPIGGTGSKTKLTVHEYAEMNEDHGRGLEQGNWVASRGRMFMAVAREA